VKKGHLYSFGQSHSVYKKVFNPENPMPINVDKLPGPGSYNDKSQTMGSDGIKYGMQGRSLNMAGKSKSDPILIS